MEQFMTEKGEINYNSIWILKWSTREEGLGQIAGSRMVHSGLSDPSGNFSLSQGLWRRLDQVIEAGEW